MTADELVTLYLLLRRINAMAREQKYRDHPFRERLESLMDSAHDVQGLTNTDIVRKLGMPLSTMCNYKSGATLPSAENLIKLADYFGVSTDYLLGREGYEMEENE